MEEEVLEQEPVEVEEESYAGQNEPVAEPEPKIVIRTAGSWKKFEESAKQELEVGKTYRLQFGGNCEVMISADKPKFGIITNEIVYTKEADKYLWIKTGV